MTPLESSIETGDWSPTTTAAIKETGTEAQSVVVDLKSGDAKKLHKLNKELTKQIGQLTKSVDALRKERDALLSDKQKLKNESKSLEKELKKARDSTRMEKGHLRQQLSQQELVEVAEDRIELSRKVESLETQLAEREGEIANLQQKLELQGELFETRSGLVVSTEHRNYTPDSEIPRSKLAVQKNGDTLNLALERLLEEQDITARFRRENLELKVRVSSLEVELEQLQKELVSNPNPKTHKHTYFFKRGRSHSSSGLLKYPDESPTDKTAGQRSKRSHSSNFALDPDSSSQEQLLEKVDSVSPHSSPKSSPRIAPRRLSAGDTHTLQTCLKLALEEKKSLVDQNHEMEEQLKEAKNRIDQLQKNAAQSRKFSQAQEEVELLKQTLKVALSEKAGLSEQAINFQREVEAARERIENLEKRLADSLVWKQSTEQTVEQQRELKILKEENESLKKSLVVKNSAFLTVERQHEKLKEEVAELRASVSSKIAAKNAVVGNLERRNEKLQEEIAELRASVSKSAAKNTAVGDLERQNEKLRKEIAELRASVSTKPAAKNALVGEFDRKNEKEIAEPRASVGTKLAAKTTVIGDLEQQNEKLRKKFAELRASISSKPAVKNTVVEDLEQQNEKLRKETVVPRASTSSKPADEVPNASTRFQKVPSASTSSKPADEVSNVSTKLQKVPIASTSRKPADEVPTKLQKVPSVSVSSKPADEVPNVSTKLQKVPIASTSRKPADEVPTKLQKVPSVSVSSKPADEVPNVSTKLQKVPSASTISKPADEVPNVSTKLRKVQSAEKPKESGQMSPPAMRKVAATRAMFEEKIEDSKHQTSSARHNRRSLILEREKSVTWSGGEPRYQLKEEKPVNIPPQTREAVSTTSSFLTSKPSVGPSFSTANPQNSTSVTNPSASAKPGTQSGSKMSIISVKSSVSPCASPMLNTRKEVKEVIVRSPKIERKELSSSSSIPTTQQQNQTQHHLPIRKTTSLTTSANSFQTTSLSSLSKKKQAEAKTAVTITSPVSHVKSSSFGGSTCDQDLRKPRSSSCSQQVTMVTHTPSPVSSPTTTPQVRTEKVTFKHMAGKLNVPNSIEVRRASSLQDIPETVSTSSATTGSGVGTTSPLTRSPVPLRHHRRVEKERPVTLCRADTANLTNIISRMQQQEKDQTSGKKAGGRPSRPTSFYGGDTR